MKEAGYALPKEGHRRVTYLTYSQDHNDRQKIFHNIPRWRGYNTLVKGAVGALRGGKSVACMQELIDVGMRCPAGSSIAVRESMPKAGMSMEKDLQSFLQGFAGWEKGSNSFVLPNAHRIILAPADQWDRFGSTEFVTAYIMEAQEVKYRIFETLLERLSDPAGMQKGIPWYRLIFDARGVPSKHWIAEEFLKNAWNVDKGQEARYTAKRPWWVYVRFRTEDNRRFLRPGYIEELAEMHKDDPGWRKMMLEGEIGYDLEGRPVYGSTYDPDVHDAVIDTDPSLPILRGWDWGYNSPAVVWCQYDRSGRLLVLREFCPKEISRDQFLDEALAIQEAEFPGRSPYSYRDFADIAGAQPDTTGITELQYAAERLGTSFEGLQKAQVEDGINIVRGLMRKQSKMNGKLRPHFMVDERCVTIREALRGMYYYEETATGKRIKKGNGYDDCMDAVRYVAQTVAAEGEDVGYESGGWASTYAAY